jgi:outer membrane protein assembly factor BamB
MKRTAIQLIWFILISSGCAGLRIDQTIRSSAQDWVTLGGSPSRSNQTIGTLVPPLDEQWQYNTVGGVSASPLVKDSVVVVGTLNGELQVVNFSNGKRLGYLTLEGPVVGTPVWDKTSLIVPLSTNNESLISIDLNHSFRPWKVVLGPIESSPLLYEDRIFVTTLEGKVFCLNKKDGSEVWKFKTDIDEFRKPIRSSPACDGKNLVFGCDDGYVYAVDRSEGGLRWKYKTGASVFATPILLKDRVVVGSLDGYVYCLEVETGKLVWRFGSGSKIYASASTNGRMVFVGAADGRFYALNADNGTPFWTFTTKSVISSAPLLSGEVLYVGSLDRTLYALQATTGQALWQYTAPGRIRVSPVLWGNTLLVTSEDKYIIALAPR